MKNSNLKLVFVTNKIFEPIINAFIVIAATIRGPGGALPHRHFGPSIRVCIAAVGQVHIKVKLLSGVTHALPTRDLIATIIIDSFNIVQSNFSKYTSLQRNKIYSKMHLHLTNLNS